MTEIKCKETWLNFKPHLTGRTIDRWCWLTSESTGLGESAMSLLHTCFLDRTSAWNFTLPFMALCVSSEISFLEEKLLPCHIFTFKCLEISTGIPGFSCNSTCLSCRTQFGHTGENTTLESHKRGRGTGENPSTIATTQQKHTKTQCNHLYSESGLDHVNRNITGQFNFNNFKIKSLYWKKGSWNHFGHPLWLSCLHARKGDKEHDSKALSDEINALGGHHCTCDAFHLPCIFGIGMCLGEISPERLIQRHNPEALTRYLYSISHLYKSHSPYFGTFTMFTQQQTDRKEGYLTSNSERSTYSSLQLTSTWHISVATYAE
jgi:hypothetical protein